jgi:ABC-2 type transport system permease protein
LSAAAAPRAPLSAEGRHLSAGWVFWALLVRDATVVKRELIFFLLRTAMQPLMFTVVFGFLMPRMGLVQRGYTAALLPGVLAVSLALAAVQSVALPLVADFGWTREIEDRLLAPVPSRLVALEKIVAGAVQGVIAAVFVLPLARLIMGPVEGLALANVGEILAILVLGSIAFSAIGLYLGTVIEGAQVGLMFGLIIAPMIMFGCAYYPWSGLDRVPAMKYAVLINPLTYVAEGLRAVLVPDKPHMPMAAVLAGLVVVGLGSWRLGLKAFMKRAVG